jgi:5-deoxy-D-glucuronate isomerase
MTVKKQDDLFGKKPEPGKTAPPAPPAEPAKQPEVIPPQTVAASAAEVALVVAPGQDIKEIEMTVDVETKMLDVIRQRQKNKKELIKIAIQQTTGAEKMWILKLLAFFSIKI